MKGSSCNPFKGSVPAFDRGTEENHKTLFWLDDLQAKRQSWVHLNNVHNVCNISVVFDIY
jgi:hypothetical protein